LAELNRFTKQLTNGRFATLVIARLDPRTHILIYAYAGHPPALLLSVPATF
jgi:serine phosphatase RsbU (regulator of sigma subunit)